MVPASPFAESTDNTLVKKARWAPRILRRQVYSGVFALTAMLCTLAGIGILVFLLWTMAKDGTNALTWEFLNHFPSRFPDKAGIKAAIWGSAYMAVFTALFAIPVGVGAAIYLEEFSEDSRFRRMIDTNIANLAGVPSIVYGMLGLAVFVRALSMGRSILAGSLTMAILILPIIIVSAREALKAVPQSLRHAAYALGATQWQTVKSHVLPAATPGILTGVILSMARAAGETAPLILIGALNFVAFVPEGPMDSFTVLPIQIFNWVSRPQEAFHSIAAAGMIVLVAMLMVTNGIAVAIRMRSQRKIQW
jgi:phosphate transport system permease protein